MWRKSISRREFTKISIIGVPLILTGRNMTAYETKRFPLRLGGPIFEKIDEPDRWCQQHKNLGYSAAYCPLEWQASDDVVAAVEQAARTANIVIAEVGAWSNPISPDEDTRKNAIEKCIRQLNLADRIGACCCVNISGSRGSRWDGPDADNLTEDTLEMIVTTTRHIIDQVKPKRTFFTLETMPWAVPDSAESYLRLIKSIDRKQFAVHLDPVNIINSPQRYYHNAAVIVDCFRKLGAWIKSCHAKDILLQLARGKPIALGEIGQFPDVTVLDQQPAGEWFMSWGNLLTRLNDSATIQVIYDHPRTLTLDNVRPDDHGRYRVQM